MNILSTKLERIGLLWICINGIKWLTWVPCFPFMLAWDLFKFLITPLRPDIWNGSTQLEFPWEAAIISVGEIKDHFSMEQK